MPYYRKLVGTKCYLSPPSTEDAQSWAGWFNDLDVALPLGDEAQMVSGLAQEERNVQEAMKSDSHVFSIVDLESDRLIGRCMLFNIDQTHRHAMLAAGLRAVGRNGQQTMGRHFHSTAAGVTRPITSGGSSQQRRVGLYTPSFVALR